MGFWVCVEIDGGEKKAITARTITKDLVVIPTWTNGRGERTSHPEIRFSIGADTQTSKELLN
jgi:hypothetical protein